MSFDPFNNDDLTPDWGDFDLGWMNVDSKPEPEPEPEHPVQHRRPEPEPEHPVQHRRPEQEPERPVQHRRPEPEPERPVQRRRPEQEPEHPVQRRRPEPEPERPVQHRRPEQEPERPVQRRRPEPEPERPVQRRRPEPEPERPAQHRRPEPDRRLPREEREPAYLREKKTRGGSNLPMIIVIVILVGGMIFAGAKLAGMFFSYQRDRSAYNELANRAISGLAEAEATTAPDISTSLNDIVDATAPEKVESEIPFQVDWEYLASVNSDIIGWLYCPDTIIDYPVLQTSDNDYYLTHGADNSYRAAGALFADCGSVLGVNLSNFIIYGHNMKDASMFGSYRNYSKVSYYDEHPTMYLLTPTQSYRIDLLCCHTVGASLDNFPTYFGSAGDYQTYLNMITSSSYWVNYDAVSTDYQLVTMSTCTGNSDYRLLVQGILVPIQ